MLENKNEAKVLIGVRLALNWVHTSMCNTHNQQAKVPDKYTHAVMKSPFKSINAEEFSDCV